MKTTVVRLRRTSSRTPRTGVSPSCAGCGNPVRVSAVADSEGLVLGRFRRRLLVLAFGLLTACAGRQSPQSASPQETLAAYAAALDAGRVEEAYQLLSSDAKKAIPFEAFQRMVQENPDEVRQIAQALTRPAGAPVVTATVTAPNGETLVLVLEDGRWRIDGSTVDLYSQTTPRAAIESFLLAYENQRYDVLLRFVPETQAHGLDAAKLKAAWEGEQKEEMDRLTQALRAALPTARFETLGDRATMAYGAAGTVELVREGGVWKIEDFR